MRRRTPLTSMTGALDVAGPRALWLTQTPIDVADGDVAIVLDATWTPGPETAGAPRLLPVRGAIDSLLRRFDPIAVTSSAIDAWAVRSGVIEAMTIGQTSIWYNKRLRHWTWLQERVLWAHLLRTLLDQHGPTRIICEPGTDEALVDVLLLIAEADGIELRLVGDASNVAASRATPANAVRAASTGRRTLASRVAGRLGRLLDPGRDSSRSAWSRQEAEATRALLDDRMDRLASEAGQRLLVVLNHHAQRVETPSGPRMLNPYLGSVADRLAGTVLDPILIDWRLKGLSAATRERLESPGMERTLPQDVVRFHDEPPDPALVEWATRSAGLIRDVRVPIKMCGIDLGPALAAQVGDSAMRWLPDRRQSIERLGRLIRRLHVRGILVADEYHRQDWLEAARAAGVPVAAIQHGTIYRHHRGYIHGERPPQLRLANRTYVYGRWERDLLVHGSVYRDDEVVIGGSPRLDLYRPEAIDREAVRTEYGIAPGDLLLVLSGTYGDIYRRFHYPAVLARVFDRPMPGVHLVVKQHPAEVDEGPYRAVIEGVAAAGGFAPLPITVVRDVDLYRLLASADAHLGIHSTVLTEAVFVGTPNLMGAGVCGGDLLDYVDAGVAVPVTDGGDVLAALGAVGTGGMTEKARSAFIAAHYEPGAATDRIAADLLAWLAGSGPGPGEPE